MASSKCGLVVAEALAKAAEMILLNRVLRPSELSRSQGRTRFNVEVDEVDVIRGLMEYWRRDLCLPLVILVVWRPTNGNPTTLLERWEFRYTAAAAGGRISDESAALASVRSLWKRLVILLRTLYSVSVSLPGARLSRQVEVDSRRGGNLSYGSIGFAVCTREIDSDGWLVLNGHASSAYEATPPMHFNGDAESMALPTARCIFGSLTVNVCYALGHAQQLQLLQPGPSKTDDRTPSGLSLLLARAPDPTSATRVRSQAPSKESAAPALRSCLFSMPMAQITRASSLKVSVPSEFPCRRTLMSPLPLGPWSLDEASRRLCGRTSLASDGANDVPFGLPLAALADVPTLGDTTTLHERPPCATSPIAATVASTPPFATSSHYGRPSGEGAHLLPCQRRISPFTGSPPFAALFQRTVCRQSANSPRIPTVEFHTTATSDGDCADGDNSIVALGRSSPSFARLVLITPSTPPGVCTCPVNLPRPWVTAKDRIEGNDARVDDHSRQPSSLALLAPLSRIRRTKAGGAQCIGTSRRDRSHPLPFAMDLAPDESCSRPFMNVDAHLHSPNSGAKLAVASRIRLSCASPGGWDPANLYASASSTLVEFGNSTLFWPYADLI